ncbi:MAG: peptidylprolyl isomerase [Campylobacterota bacterium]|nr:peptidylprolyl isomerase [Campylobacterota bacterium]
MNKKGKTMATASARHILVQSEDQCIELKSKIESGEVTFEEVARDHSLCPSGVKGGELGTFSQGQMVPEFDEVVFNGEIGSLHGPIKTQFGYHLLEVKERSF